jgi:hypothetical protein
VDRVFATLGLGPSARAEEIPPDGFVALEREFYEAVGHTWA